MQLLAGSLKWILIAFIPVSVFFIIYPSLIIEIIFQRGAFNEASTLLTTKPFLVYSTGLVFFAIESILVIFYYSSADTKTPVFVGIGCVIINIALTWIFIRYIGYIGIALAFVVQKCIKNIILLYLLKHKIKITISKIWPVLLKISLSAFIFTTIVFTCKFLLRDILYNKLMMKIGGLAIIFIVSGIVYMATLYFFNVLKIGNSINYDA